MNNKIEKYKVVYLFYSPLFNYSKIGITDNIDFRKRSIELNSGLQLETYYYTLPSTNALYIESEAHKHFDKYRVQGEWFNIDKDIIKDYLSNITVTVPLYVDMYLNRYSVKEIALKYNVTRQYIESILNDVKVKETTEKKYKKPLVPELYEVKMETKPQQTTNNSKFTPEQLNEMVIRNQQKLNRRIDLNK